MKIRNLLFILLLSAIMLFTLTGCSAKPSAEPAAATTPAAADSEKVPDTVFTLEELAKYNGQNGNPAYVAVDGVVYDVTQIPYWKGGKHNGFEAGKDLTDAIKNVSPHGTSKLKGLPIVGKLK